METKARNRRWRSRTPEEKEEGRRDSRAGARSALEQECGVYSWSRKPPLELFDLSPTVAQHPCQRRRLVGSGRSTLSVKTKVPVAGGTQGWMAVRTPTTIAYQSLVRGPPLSLGK